MPLYLSISAYNFKIHIYLILIIATELNGIYFEWTCIGVARGHIIFSERLMATDNKTII